MISSSTSLISLLKALRLIFSPSFLSRIFRTSWLFGKQGNNFPKKVLTQAQEGKPLTVVSDQIGTPTYTGDLAEAIGKILNFFTHPLPRHENQIYHLANEGVVSRYEFAQSILKKRNYSPTLVTPVSSESDRSRPARRPQNSSLSMEKVKAHFGLQLRSWEEALEAYFQEDPSLPRAERSPENSLS